MNKVQIEAMKQVILVLYEREHRAGLTADELVAYHACRGVVSDETGEYYSGGQWYQSQF